MLNRLILFFDLNDTKRNQRLTYLVLLCSLILFISGFLFYASNRFFMVKKIIVLGNLKHVTSTQLDYVANNKLHGTFFTLNIDELKSQFMLLPWVKDVVVERVFPGTIIVKYTEYNAIARVGNDALLADNYEIFDGAESRDDLPVLNVEPSMAVWAYNKYLELNKVLLTHGIKVLSITSDSKRVFAVETNNEINMVFCTQNLSTSLKNLQIYWDKLYQLNSNIHYMNFCYANSVAIK